jgi:parallel beta-helix repeat protein
MLQRHALEKLFALFLLTIAICLLADTAQSATIVVNPGDSIQAAIDASTPGDTILVNGGIYKENVNVTKKLILRGVDTGMGMPVVDAEKNGSAFTLSTDEITLEGFNAINASWYPDAGINVLSNNNTIRNNNASSNDLGIRLSQSFNNTIRNNTFTNNEYGIYLYFSDNNNISGNSIRNNIDAGIPLRNSNNNSIFGNNASGNYIGIALSDSINNIMRNNMMSGNVYNFYAMRDNDIDTSNLVDGKPIYFLIDVSSEVIDSSTNAGTVFCLNCENILVKDLDFENNG